MKDMFGQKLDLNDLIVYRLSKSIYSDNGLAVGVVKVLSEKFIKCISVAIVDGVIRRRDLSTLKSSCTILKITSDILPSAIKKELLK